MDAQIASDCLALSNVSSKRASVINIHSILVYLRTLTRLLETDSRNHGLFRSPHHFSDMCGKLVLSFFIGGDYVHL